MFHRNSSDKEAVRRMPSAPVTSLPIQEIFRRSGHWSHRGDVARGDAGLLNC